MTQGQVADAWGMTQGAISQYLGGGILLNLEIVVRFATLLGVDEEEFAPRWILEQVEALRRSERVLDQFVSIPYYDAPLAGGAGASGELGERPPVMVRRDMLEQASVDPKMLCAVDVSKDSMAPQLRDGDTVLVRRDRRTIEDGKVYALNHGDDRRVKRVFRPKPNFLILRSDNEGPDSGPELLRTGDLDEMTVIGLVWLRIGPVS